MVEILIPVARNDTRRIHQRRPASTHRGEARIDLDAAHPGDGARIREQEQNPLMRERRQPYGDLFIAKVMVSP